VSLHVIEGGRGETIREVLERALEHVDEFDGVVVLLQRKKGGVIWDAPGSMRLETMVFFLWSVLSQFGLMATGKL
jgi:hypothetical protein